MLSRLAHCLLIAALLGLLGTHWALMQSFAWARMLADNSNSYPLTVAIAKTFDGKHPCDLCKQIAQGQGEESKSDSSKELRKLEFVNQPVAILILPGLRPAVVQSLLPRAYPDPHSPPTPPPEVPALRA